ncbi:MAG: chorismate mutase [Acidimicrobiia bacterium]
MKLRAIRGAITCDANTKAEIDAKTARLIEEILSRNDLDHEGLVSIMFTATEDLTAEFPAAAARALGLGDVPLLCARELAIDHGMAHVVRVLVHCYTDKDRSDLHHVYLDGARALRDDLPE